jgi:hypothetical protein
MKLLMENWRKFINEESEYDEHFQKLMHSGREGALQAIELAASFGMSSKELPWDAKSIYRFVNPEGRGMFGSEFAKLVGESEHITGWSLDDYNTAVVEEQEAEIAQEIADNAMTAEEAMDEWGMDREEYEELWQKYLNEQRLSEATVLEKDLKGAFRQAIEASQFWTQPNAESDVDIGDHGDEMITPAGEALRSALNEKAQELNTDLHFIVTVSNEYALTKDDPYGGYPNNWMKHGMYQGPTKGAHVIWIELRPLGEDYKPSEMNPSKLVGIVSRTLNHELVHYKQLKRQVEAKGISEEEAWEELLCDPEQVPVPQDPKKRAEWAERCGKEPPEQDPGRSTYLSRHSEIDAYAHEAAEQLIDKYGAQEALQLIKQRDSNVLGVLADYRKVFKDDRETMKKFLKKLYTQIKG